MAEARRPHPPLSRRAKFRYVNRISNLIENNYMENVKTVLKELQPDELYQVLDCSIGTSTPLFMAIDSKNEELAIHILKLSLQQGRCESCANWKQRRQLLVHAMAVDSENLIELILQNMCDMDNFQHGPYTPLMVAIIHGNIEIVRLIVRLGADVNRACFDGTSPLMAAVGDMTISRLLLAHHADPNHQNADGSTALHLAVNTNHQSCILMLDTAGADVRIKNNQGITPFMLAGINGMFPLVLYLSEHPAYSDIDRIESFELMSACLMCTEEMVTLFCVRALQMRSGRFIKRAPFPPQDILNYSLEFTKEYQLEEIHNDPLKLAFQAVLVIERILGRNNTLYMRALVQIALVAARRKSWEKLRQIIEYLPRYYQPTLTDFVNHCLNSLCTLFKEIASDGDPENFFENGAFAVYRLVAEGTVKMWNFLKASLSLSAFVEHFQYREIFDAFLCLTSEVRDRNLPQSYAVRFYNVVAEVVREDPRLMHRQSLLHRAIKLTYEEEWATVGLIGLLLKCGADVDSKDFYRGTPIMYALRHAPSNKMKEIGKVLLEYRCHLDCINSEGFTAMEFYQWPDISIDLNNVRSLQCLAVGAILENGIYYEEALTKTQKDFVNLHK